MSDDQPNGETMAPSSKRPKSDSNGPGSAFPPNGPNFAPAASYGGPPPPGQFPMQPQPGFPNPMWQGQQPPPYGNQMQMPWQPGQQMPPQGAMYRPQGPPRQDRPPDNWNGYRGPVSGDRSSPKDSSNGNGAPFPPNGQRFQPWSGAQQPWPQQQWGPGGPSPQMWQQGHPMPSGPTQPMQPMMPPKLWPGGNMTPSGAGMRSVGTGGGRPRASPESLPSAFPSGATMNGMVSGQLCKPVDPVGSVNAPRMAADNGGRDENDDETAKKAKAAKDSDKARGSYRCGKCGEPKKGHICPYQPKIQRRPDEPPPETRNAAIQVEMDEFMTLRRLNIEIQGLPESYATAGHVAGTMVVGEPHPFSFDEHASLTVSASGQMGELATRPLGLQASASQMGSVHSFGLQASSSQNMSSIPSFGIQKYPSRGSGPLLSTDRLKALSPVAVNPASSSEPAENTVTSEV